MFGVDLAEPQNGKDLRTPVAVSPRADAANYVGEIGLERDFKVVERFAPSILTQAVGAAVKVDTRLMLDRALIVAKRSGVSFNVATIPANFSAPSKGPFDPGYMGPLFQTGYDLGKSQSPFKTQPPPYPAQAVSPSNHIEKTGANQ